MQLENVSDKIFLVFGSATCFHMLKSQKMPFTNKKVKPWFTLTSFNIFDIIELLLTSKRIEQLQYDLEMTLNSKI